MNQNLTQREWLSRTTRGTDSGVETARGDARPTAVPDAGGTPALPGEGTRERLAREILEVSGPMRRPDRHRHWLLSLEVDVLKQRLEILVKEKLTTDGHR